ncbi:pentapeptide repeat-containing protein [Nocardia crassostreae]|uniref:pentapeptide repeat-containing protein n=1 Tax=Nocardia crassostreae TaxID=53428 RepID=UPI000A021141|nr:pentapeptide repeat-containing protein [Nocardia crassostreae]
MVVTAMSNRPLLALHCADGRGSNLTGADFAAGYLRGINMSGANLDASNLSDTDLREADLSDADLLEADLDRADLRGANLRGATLRRAILTGVVFGDAVLQDADLTGAILDGADLSQAQLPTLTEMSEVRWSATTRWGLVHDAVAQSSVALGDGKYMLNPPGRHAKATA